MKFAQRKRGDVGEVLIFFIAVIFLLVVFKIDIIGFIHRFVVAIANAF